MVSLLLWTVVTSHLYVVQYTSVCISIIQASTVLRLPPCEIAGNKTFHMITTALLSSSLFLRASIKSNQSFFTRKITSLWLYGEALLKLRGPVIHDPQSLSLNYRNPYAPSIRPLHRRRYAREHEY